MVVRSLDGKKDILRSWEDNEELFVPEVPYLNVIGKLMYLGNNTWLDIIISMIFIVWLKNFQLYNFKPKSVFSQNVLPFTPWRRKYFWKKNKKTQTV
jgi:hypothetical protein